MRFLGRTACNVFNKSVASRLLSGMVRGVYCAATGFVLVGITVGSLTLDAVDREWIAESGGSFQNAENWEPSGVPGPADSAIFDLDVEELYEVDFTLPATNFRLILHSDRTGLDLGGNQYTLTDGTATGPGQHLTGLSVAPFEGDEGLLVVENGELSTGAVQVGGEAGSSGSIVLRGANTTWFNEAFDELDGNVFGREGFASLSVLDGAVADFDMLVFNREEGSESELIVSGENSLLEGWDLLLAQAGRGDFTVSDGGRVSARNNIDVVRGGVDSTLVIDGGTIDASGRIWLGSGPGTLDIEMINGAVLESGDDSIIVGRVVGTGADLEMSGGSRLSSGEHFQQRVNSNMEVSGEGTIVEMDLDFFAGWESADAPVADLTVRDGASMDVGRHVRAGRDGLSSWTVENATVNVGEHLRLAITDTGESSLFVDNSTVEVGGDLRVGDGGAWAEMEVRNGGVVNVGNRLQQMTASALTLTGEDSRLEAEDDSLLGWTLGQESTLSVSDGAFLRIGNDIRHGRDGHSDFTIDDATVDIGRWVRLAITDEGESSMIVDNGGMVTSGVILHLANGQNTVADLVLRGGSEWDSTVGEVPRDTKLGGSDNAQGNILVEGGSQLRIHGETAFRLGDSEGGEGTVSVTGEDSRLEGGNLDIFVGGDREGEDDEGQPVGGVAGIGYLEVADGGVVDVGGELFLWETGTLQVDGGQVRAGEFGISGESGAVVSVVLGSGQNPYIEIAGDANLGESGTLEIGTVDGLGAVPGDTFTLVDYGGTLTGAFAGLPEGGTLAADGYEFEITYQADGGAILLTTVSAPDVPGVSFTEWIDGFDLPEGQTDPEANPSGDGISNAMKYALDLDPRVSARDEMPIAEVTEIDGTEYLVMEVHKNPQALNVNYNVVISDDLLVWEGGEDHVTVIEETDALLRVRDNTPVSDLNKRFIRLAIELE